MQIRPSYFVEASSRLLAYEVTFDNLIPFLQKPSAWNLQAVQVWFQSVIVTKDFIYFIYCLTFVTSHLYLKCESIFVCPSRSL